MIFMDISEMGFADQMIAVGKRLDDKNLLTGTGGNISTRLNDNSILITASGLCKGMLTYADFTKVDLQGNKIYGPKPARDIYMHMALYNSYPNIKAIAHAHSPITTGFSISDYSFDDILLTEVFFDLRNIAKADYAVPTTTAVPDAIEKALQKKPESTVVVMKNHGVLAFSEKDVFDAGYKLEVIEMVCKSIFVAKIIGGEKIFTHNEIEDIKSVLNS
jgi:L-fuculose-phosphate aldolase